jgi:uncharacterized membrane protein YtjA (UPF0391 family)
VQYSALRLLVWLTSRFSLDAFISSLVRVGTPNAEGATINQSTFLSQEKQMLRLAISLLIISLIFAVFGFTGIAASFAGVAKILFYVFIALFAIAAIANVLRGKKIPTV